MIDVTRHDGVVVFTVRGDADARAYASALERADLTFPPEYHPLRLWDLRAGERFHDLEAIDAANKAQAAARGAVRTRVAILASDGGSIQLARQLCVAWPSTVAEIFHDRANAFAWLHAREEAYWEDAGYRVTVVRLAKYMRMTVVGRLDAEAITNCFARVNQPADDRYMRRLWDLRGVVDVHASGFEIESAAATQRPVTNNRRVAFVVPDSRARSIVAILGVRQPNAVFEIFENIDEATTWILADQ